MAEGKKQCVTNDTMLRSFAAPVNEVFMYIYIMEHKVGRYQVETETIRN